MSSASSGPIVLIGAGNMGGAMLSGWLKSGVAGSSIVVIDPGPSEQMMKTINDAGVTHVTSAPAGLTAGVLFLAVKPQVMDAVLPPVKGTVGSETVVVSVAAGKTLKAIAFKSGLTPSAVASGLYSVANPCATPAFSPAAGAYPTFPKSITITCATSGATMRWTTDGSSPSQTHGTVYSGPVSVAIGQTLKAIAYKTGLADSAIASGLYTGKTATPDIQPPSGLYSGGFNVTITCSTPGSTIKYTKDGSTPSPTHGTTYSGAFAVLPYVVVKAIAFGAAGYANSEVATNVYDLID